MINSIIMASGYGRRMGQDKLFLLFKDKTLIQHIMDKVESCNFYTTIVVARDERILNLAINKGFKAIKNNSADLGQSESIKLGLNNAPRADGYMFFTADQPLLDIETIKLLTSTFENNKNSIIVPRYKGENGSPVIFPFKFIEELKKLHGDRGGRGVIKEQIDYVIYVEVKNEYMLMDVDTIEDYERILKDYEKIIDTKG